MFVKISIDEKMLNELTKEEIRKKLDQQPDRCWWDMKRLELETCRKRDWIIENILLNPNFKEEMKLISNGREGGRWMFRGEEMRRFLDRNFHYLNRATK
ncbi:DUF771 domain-containing protein [Paenibacillus cucumis (ex Kampfer et al. 2016)]|uniref:DUF771 domain-containing protein n=1 Tax=Paenibacillus cucumis (ex Kampfer et al. 2016) TaxID=1776858 RepID=A0ABS7KCZ3_9BACL|nr:DUF771 domain-containing protein [Paenibacillus cucumis (ex Kampfer et al. 2016)]MBY0202000.1 DUF771 domain-containing protein [Paenibacillus cucumis (ex Kampfer et al. 2016)]